MRKGHSLLEVMVSLSLLSVLLTVLVSLFVQGTRSTTRTDRQAELGGLTQAALLHLTRDLESAGLDSVAVAPDGLSFMQSAAVTPDGKGLTWSHYVLYWLERDLLLRCEYPAVLPAPAPLVDASAHRLGGRVVARGVARFVVAAHPDDPRAFRVTLAVARRWGGKDHGFELESAVRVRN